MDSSTRAVGCFAKYVLVFENVFPACPIFDESGTGIILHGYHLPVEKLGLNFCLNRPTTLYYIKKYEDEEEDKNAEDGEERKFQFDVEVLSKDDYFAGFAKFSSDYKYLTYFSVKEEFHTHATAFALNAFKDLALTTEEHFTVVERDAHDGCKNFCGLYGYHFVHDSAKFIEGIFFLIQYRYTYFTN
jgi:hypothetical protein